jgi:uncharacterized damage-inducible protein DinB
MKRINFLLLLAILFACSAVTLAQDTTNSFRKDFLRDLRSTQKKFVDLGNAMPAESYSWRPMAGVRSLSEVYMHVAASNYKMLTSAGIKTPDGYPDNDTSITEKSKVVEALNKSFDYVRDQFNKLSDADLAKSVKLYGTATTVQGVFFSVAMHEHEHLGQSIAYARQNKIVPPWTAEQQMNRGKKRDSE